MRSASLPTRSLSLNNALVTRWLSRIVFLALAAGPLCAETAPFVPFDADGALGHATVAAIAVGPAGFLWIGTERGLFRYDGVAVVNASRTDPALPPDAVTALLTDRFGAMWVATRRSGLYRYDPAVRRFSAVERIGGAAREITALASDAHGRIWVGTRRAGALRFNPADGSVDRYEYDPLDSGSLGAPAVADIAVAPDGRVAVATPDRGLTVVHPDGRVAVHRFAVGATRGLPSDELTGLAVDASGTLVVADRRGGVGRFDPATGAYEPIAGAPRPGVAVTLLEYGDDGAFWIGWRDARLVRISPDATETFAPPAPVVALVRDGAGLVWAGMYAGGLARYDPRADVFERMLAPAASGRRRLVTSLAEGPDGTVWAGVDAEGLVALGQRSGAALSPETDVSLPGAPAVLDAHAGPDGIDIALGAAGHARARVVPAADGTAPNGSARGGTASGTSPELPPVTSVHRDGGRLLLGTAGWGVVVNAPGREPVRHDLGGATVHAIESAGAGRFWIGTDGPELVLLSPDRGVVERVGLGGGYASDEAGAAPDDAIWTIDVQPDGTLWAAARSAGVFRYEPDRGVTVRLRPGVDFEAQSVRGAVSDRLGGLWFTTSDGLYRLDERSGRLDRYSAADGTGMDEYASGAMLRASDGTIYAGGPAGVVRFDPARLGPADYQPPVVIAAVSVAGEPVPWSDLAPAEGPHSHDPRVLAVRPATAFSVTAASLDFSDPGSLRYSYRLVGTGDGRSRAAAWVDAGAGRAFSFAGLAPGAYRLYVRATNGDGVPVREPAVLDVVVERPWSRTPGAIVLFVVAGILVVALVAGWIRARRALAGIDARLSPR